MHDYSIDMSLVWISLLFAKVEVLLKVCATSKVAKQKRCSKDVQKLN